MVTTFRVIENANGSIQLHDLYNETTGKYYKEPALNFVNVDYEGFWDNTTYVLNFLRGLKKEKKKQRKELKTFCENNSLNFEETRTDLIDIYKQSRKLKYWKNGINKLHK